MSERGRRGLKGKLGLISLSAVLVLTGAGCSIEVDAGQGPPAKETGVAKEVASSQEGSPAETTVASSQAPEETIYANETATETVPEETTPYVADATVSAEQEVLEELPEASTATADVQPPALTGTQQPEIEEFVSAVAADVDAFWYEAFATAGQAYSSPYLQFVYDEPIDTGTAGCGVVDQSMGPLYCPDDQTVYYAVDTLIPLLEQYGTQTQYQEQYIDEFGDFAVAYTIAHEMAHHVQGQSGILQAKQRGELYTIQTELQADCLAGVWANSAYYQGVLEAGDIEEGLLFAASIADSSGTAMEDPSAHGTSEQRMEWFMYGYDNGDGADCATY